MKMCDIVSKNYIIKAEIKFEKSQSNKIGTDIGFKTDRRLDGLVIF